MDRKRKHTGAVTLMLTVYSELRQDGNGMQLTHEMRQEWLTRKWKVEKYYQNGVDKTTAFYELMPGYEEKYRKDGRFSYSTRLSGQQGNWALLSGKDVVRVSLAGGQIIDEVIVKLSEKEFCYYYMDGNNREEYHMVPV